MQEGTKPEIDVHVQEGEKEKVKIMTPSMGKHDEKTLSEWTARLRGKTNWCGLDDVCS